MNTRADTISAVESAGVIAVVRVADADRLPTLVDALVGGGVRIIEITMTVPGAIDHIRALTESRRDIVLGAGTVLDAATAERAIDSGARFVVSPVFRPELIDVCHQRNVVTMPGCFSPTEILAAWEAGADFVKVFPATALGPSFFKDVKAPLPFLKLVPTGGVTIDNAGEWIRAGAAAVGVGTALLDAAAIAAGDFDVIRGNAARIMANVRAARGHR